MKIYPYWWRATILRLQPHLQIYCVGDPGMPAKGASDPELLIWCEAHDCMLVTNNRHTMSRHLAAHVAQGRHVTGILVVDPALHVHEVASELSLIEGASFPGEYRDQVRHLPIT